MATTTLNTSSIAPSASMDPGYEFRDPLQIIVVGVIMVVQFAFGTIANIMIILPVVVSRRLRSPANLLVVNLAVADLLVCCILPWNAYVLLSPLRDNGTSPFAYPICEVITVVTYLAIGSTMYALLIVAADRFFAVYSHNNPIRVFYTCYYVSILVGVAWIIPFLAALVPPLFGIGQFGFSSNLKMCTGNSSHASADRYNFVLAAVNFAIPFVIVVYSYLMIYARVRRNNLREIARLRKRESHRDNEAITQILREHSGLMCHLVFYSVTFLFLACPYPISLFVASSTPVRNWLLVLFVLNSCQNPVLYAIRNPHYIRVIVLLLRCKYAEIAQPSRVLRGILELRHTSIREARHDNHAHRRISDAISLRTTGIYIPGFTITEDECTSGAAL